MTALDIVKGPHWAQILSLFGSGGTVSEALKDRNTVQIKDKARNLKLFFLKSRIEVPYHLQFVTGDLKTRAPRQDAKNAARKAADERAEENTAHLAAVTTLCNGHRDEVSAFNQTPPRDKGQLSADYEGGSSDRGDGSELCDDAGTGVCREGAGLVEPTTHATCHNSLHVHEREVSHNLEGPCGMKAAEVSSSMHEHQVLRQSPMVLAAHLPQKDGRGDYQRRADTVVYPRTSSGDGDVGMRMGADGPPGSDQARVVSG